MTTTETTFFEAPEQYLVIIASCTGTKLKPVLDPFLAEVIEKYPQANFYPNRNDGSKDKPGTIRVVGGGDQRQLIICYAQFYPGKNNLPSDSRSARVVWFKKCLDKIVKRPEVESLAFPEDIARDGGGDWEEYQQVIQDTADYIKLERPKLQLKIYPTDLKSSKPTETSETETDRELEIPGSTSSAAPRMIGLRGIQQRVYMLETLFMLDTSQRVSKSKLLTPKPKVTPKPTKPAVKLKKPAIKKPTKALVMTSDQIMSDSDDEVISGEVINDEVDGETEAEGKVETNDDETDDEGEVEASDETEAEGKVEASDEGEVEANDEDEVEAKAQLVSMVKGAKPKTNEYDANPNWRGLSSLPIDQSWQKLFQDRLLQAELKKLESFFEQELEDFGDFYAVLPQPPENIFRAFQQPLNQVRVVILGQDPYHSKVDEAMGLSFSVPEGVKLPPSLRNIFKELLNDLPETTEPTNGDLSHWAEQGVLLLNTSLTVRQSKPGVHLEQWQKFTDRVIQLLAQDESRPKVFLLWGSPAQKKASLIAKHNRILKAVHPSPLSAHRGWFGSKHFSKTNQILKDWNLKPIKW